MMKKQSQKTTLSSSSADFIKKVHETRALVQNGKIPSDQATEVTKRAWEDLCQGLGLSLKEFSTCRSLVDACVAKWPNVTEALTEAIFSDLILASEKQDARLFSRTLLSALDCESSRKCVRQVLSTSLSFEKGSRLHRLLGGIAVCLKQLEVKLGQEEVEISREFLETQRDAERLCDCAGRIVSFVTIRQEAFDVVLRNLWMSTERLILITGKHGDIHLLRSASLSLHHINASYMIPAPLRTILFEGNLSVAFGKNSTGSGLPAITRSALLLGALSCAANNFEVDSTDMLSDLLDTIENCLSVSGNSEDDEAVLNEEDEPRFEKITLACEALCAWSTKVKSCINCTSALIERAIQLVIVYMDHRESSVGTVCATAFERLIETCLRVKNGEEVLSKVFVEQMSHVSSPDFASARRGLYPMMEKLVTVLGATRVSELYPTFVRKVMHSAFRADEMTSSRPELGNGICNLVVCFLRSWMCQLDFKLTKEFKADLDVIANVLKRGPDNLFASYFVCRRLLNDLLGEAKSPQEQEAIREMGRTLLMSLQNPFLESERPLTTHAPSSSVTMAEATKSAVPGSFKRSFKESQADALPEKRLEATKVDLLWARLNVLLALERGNTHIVILEGADDPHDVSTDGQEGLKDAKTHGKKKYQHGTAVSMFTLSASVLRRSLLHERYEVRDAAWALASTRVKRTKFPEPLLLQETGDALPFVLKYEGLSLKPSILRLVDRIAFCLDANVGGGDDGGDETAKVASKLFISKCAGDIANCIYPGAPIDRVALALDLAVHFVQQFQRRPSLIKPLLLPGTTRTMLATLESPFDAARAQAYEFLCNVPGVLPGLDTRTELERWMRTEWYPKLSSKMRRDADSAALFFRLIHSKYCLQLGWKIDLFGMSGEYENTSTSDTTRELEADLNRCLSQAEDAYFMRCALEEARKCTTVPTAYDVGCVIVDDKSGEIVSTGFSRELPGNTHAEECALKKLGLERGVKVETDDDCALGNAHGTTLYTTMEPCSLRLSGNRPCCDRCIAAKVARVVVGVKEPDKFVQNCEGWILLEKHGILVQSVTDGDVLAECAVLANANDHTVPARFAECKRQSWERFTNRVDLPRETVGLHFCHQLLDLLESLQRSSAGTESGEDVAMHGCIMTLRYALADISFQQASSAKIKLIRRLLDILMHTLDLGVSKLVKLEEGERLNAHMVTTEDDDFIVKTVSWLSVREGSELLSEILEKMVFAFKDNYEEFERIIQQHCGWFLSTSLRLRHLGAMTYVTKGLERICKVMLQSESSVLQRIPQNAFVRDLFAKLGIEEFDRALRRTEGFSLTFRAILRACHVCNRADVIHSVLRELIKICNPGTSTNSFRHHIAALNVMCILFEDAILARSVMQFISPALELVVNGFRSEIWGIRNASLNVFVSLIKRSVGEPDQALGGDEEAHEQESSSSRTKSHSTTAKLFFKTHPKLLPFLLNELIAAISSSSTEQEHPSLHPVLLFLSSLRRSSMVKDDPALDFIPHVERVVLEHPVYFIRSTACRALVVLTPREQVPLRKLLDILTCHEDLPQPLRNSSNACHGALLLILQWARTDVLRESCYKADLLELKRILGVQWVANEQACFLLRDVALDCCSRLLAHEELCALVKPVYERYSRVEDRQGGDGASVGRSRFEVRLMRLLLRHAVLSSDWVQVIQFLNIERRSQHLHLALNEFAVQMQLQNQLHMRLPEQTFEGLLGSVMVPLKNATELRRSHVPFHLAAVFALIRQQGRVRLAEADIEAIHHIAIATTTSNKSRALCLKILSFVSGPGEHRQHFKLFVQYLEEDSDPEAPLELRLACAESLTSVCLTLSPDGSTNEEEALVLRCWIRALYLMQDDDREVCDIVRRAVLQALPGSLGHSCLDLTFRLAWKHVTELFWCNELLQEQLINWIFCGADEALVANEFQRENTAGEEGDESEVLFKTDNVNQFFEASYFAVMAGEEMKTVKLRRMLCDASLVQSRYRNLAQRVVSTLQRVRRVLPSMNSRLAFSAAYHVLIATEAFGDPMDGETCRAFAELKRYLGPTGPLQLQGKLRDCEMRWGLGTNI